MEPPRAARTPRTRSSGLPYCRRNSARSRPFALGFRMEPPNVWITVDVKEHNVGRLGFTPSFFDPPVLRQIVRRPPTPLPKNSTHSLLRISGLIHPKAPFLVDPGPKSSCGQLSHAKK